MASPRCLFRPVREVAFRPRPQVTKRKLAPLVQSRFSSNDQKTTPVPPGTTGPNEDVGIPHVSEEAAAIDESMGKTPPDLNQGTPVQDILKRDKEAADSAPQVMKDALDGTNKAGINNEQKRSYSTSARRMAQEMSPISDNGMIMGMDYPDAGPGHKFPLPDAESLSRQDHLKRRYDPVVEQVTKSIMRDGKLSVAQKNMSEILTILRTAPPPQPNAQFPQRTLLISDTGSLAKSLGSSSPSISPNTPTTQPSSPLLTSHLPHLPSTPQPTILPRTTLPLHPIEYLTTIIDSVSPLIKIRQQRGIAGGGASLPIPVPLGVRQRRRQAIQWILGAAESRRETRLAERVARELLRVAEGTSGVWERRGMVHRLGVSARSNVRAGLMRRRR